jgi:predicted cupin superfamily sugar epimerase
MQEEISQKGSGLPKFQTLRGKQSSILDDSKNPYLQLTCEEIIAKYQLKHHPIESGRYNEVGRSDLIVSTDDLEEKQLSRPAFTSFYYLLHGNEINCFHRCAFDEVFNFYFGKPLVIVELSEETGSFRETILGNNIMKNEVLQHNVKRHTWWACYLITNTDPASITSRDVKEITDSDVPSSPLNSLQVRHEESHTVEMAENLDVVDPESYNYSFIGRTICPGIEIEEIDIESGDRDLLLRSFSKASEKINFLTRC